MQVRSAGLHACMHMGRVACGTYVSPDASFCAPPCQQDWVVVRDRWLTEAANDELVYVLEGGTGLHMLLVRYPSSW